MVIQIKVDFILMMFPTLLLHHNQGHQKLNQSTNTKTAMLSTAQVSKRSNHAELLILGKSICRPWVLFQKRHVPRSTILQAANRYYHHAVLVYPVVKYAKRTLLCTDMAGPSISLAPVHVQAQAPAQTLAPPNLQPIYPFSSTPVSVSVSQYVNLISCSSISG